MIGVAVLGPGRIGRFYARNVTLNSRCKLVAVADPVKEAASALAQNLGCEGMTDVRAAIARPDVDAVVIGTPTDTHVDLMLAAARGGKAVLCEKPVDLDIRRADAAAAEIAKLGAKVMVAFNRRFDPSARRSEARHRCRRDRRSPPGGHHQPRSRPAARCPISPAPAASSAT